MNIIFYITLKLSMKLLAEWEASLAFKSWEFDCIQRINIVIDLLINSTVVLKLKKLVK